MFDCFVFAFLSVFSDWFEPFELAQLIQLIDFSDFSVSSYLSNLFDLVDRYHSSVWFLSCVPEDSCLAVLAKLRT